MATYYNTRGLILKEADRGEADKILTIYTKDFGKIKVLGRAIRKIKSKLRAGAGLFFLSDIEFIQGKINKTLTDALLVDKFPAIKKSLTKTRTAYKVAQVLDDLVIKEEKDEGIWELLNKAFLELNSDSNLSSLKPGVAEGPEGEQVPYGVNRQGSDFMVYYYFFWSILSSLGYRPELYNCSLCQKKLTPSNLYFSPKEGGAVCQACFLREPGGQAIDVDLIKILRLILMQDWRTFRKIKIRKNHWELLKNFSENYLKYILVRD